MASSAVQLQKYAGMSLGEEGAAVHMWVGQPHGEHHGGSGEGVGDEEEVFGERDVCVRNQEGAPRPPEAACG